MRLVLGSASARRLDLVRQLGLEPVRIVAPDVDETPRPSETPLAYCRRITAAKAAAVAPAPEEAVLCADTTVAVGRRILGKPSDEDEARAFLTLLSGRRHRVITCIAVRTADRTWQRENVTTVRVKHLSKTELDGYLGTADWQGKAGGYAIQGPAAAFVPWIQGSYSGVMGLPLAETATLLRTAGVLA